MDENACVADEPLYLSHIITVRHFLINLGEVSGSELVMDGPLYTVIPCGREYIWAVSDEDIVK